MEGGREIFGITSERQGQTEGGEEKNCKKVCREEVVKGMRGKEKYIRKEMIADKDSVCVSVRERVEKKWKKLAKSHHFRS